MLQQSLASVAPVDPTSMEALLYRNAATVPTAGRDETAGQKEEQADT